jgi:hypothetical protein
MKALIMVTFRRKPSCRLLTGLVIAVIAVAAAWAGSFLKPPVVEATAEPAAATESETTPA